MVMCRGSTGSIPMTSIRPTTHTSNVKPRYRNYHVLTATLGWVWG